MEQAVAEERRHLCTWENRHASLEIACSRYSWNVRNGIDSLEDEQYTKQQMAAMSPIIDELRRELCASEEKYTKKEAEISKDRIEFLNGMALFQRLVEVTEKMSEEVAAIQRKLKHGNMDGAELDCDESDNEKVDLEVGKDDEFSIDVPDRRPRRSKTL